ncbi:nuclear pore complex protein Nup214-like [Clytia hemisphaerica]|uniref:Nucleoporin Nup159/Nup146 N-terminal domain-containing protein n=1 Tax=Clytia hemisphaerica TaxID=252671 RepID=A0A7M5X985_9CNID
MMGDFIPEVDVKGFGFQQMCRLKIGNPVEDLNEELSHVAVSSKHGLIYAVSNKTDIKVVSISTIEKIVSQGDVNVNEAITEFPLVKIRLGVEVTHLALNNDDSCLWLVYKENGSLILGLIDTKIVGLPDKSKAIFTSTCLGTTSDLYARKLCCHPEHSNLIAVCLSNGKVHTLELDANNTIKTTSTSKEGHNITSICWSPKGKQIAFGYADGRIIQYDKTLATEKKATPSPTFDDGESKSVGGLHWISSYLFIGVFNIPQETGEIPSVVMVATKKDGPATYTMLDDIYFGFEEGRKLCYYFSHITQWNVLVSLASNAMEAATVGKLGETWHRWGLQDIERAECPLNADNNDTYPVGCQISLNSTLTIKVDDRELPPAPIFCMLNTDGILCTYQMINKFPDIKHDFIVPPTPLPSGEPRRGQESSAPKPLFGGSSAATPSFSQQQSSVGGGAPSFALGANKTASSSQGFTFGSTTSSSSKPFSFGATTSASSNTAPSSSSTFTLGATPASTQSSFSLPSGGAKPAFSFGGTTAQQQPVPSMFGQKPDDKAFQPKSSEPAKSLFGQTAAPSIFGQKPTENTTSETAKPLFGQSTVVTPSTQAAPPPKSLFGQPSTSSAAPTTKPMFGQTQLTAFGAPKPTQLGSQLPSETSQPLIPAAATKSTSFSFGAQSNTTPLKHPPLQSTNPPKPMFSSNPAPDVIQPKPTAAFPSTTPVKPMFGGTQTESPVPSMNKNLFASPQQLVVSISSKPFPTQPQPIAATAFVQTPQIPKQAPAPVIPSFAPVPDNRIPSPVIPPNKMAPPPAYQATPLLHQPVAGGIHQKREQDILSQTEKLDTALQNHINEEINSFNEELEAFTKAFSSVTERKDLIGSQEEMESLTNGINSFSAHIDEYKTNMEENKTESKELRNGVLSNFQNIDEALLRKEKTEDRRYTNVLKSRQLDPVSARQRKELRAQTNHLENLLGEINVALDTEWEENQIRMNKNRQKRAPGAHQNQQIYKTIEAIEKITNNLSNRIKGISLESEESHLITMNTTRLNSQMSEKNSTSSTTVTSSKDSTMKMNQLREMLSRRGNTPVRKSKQYSYPDISLASSSSSVLPTPHNKLNPKATSTPAVDQSFFSPKSDGAFTNKMQTLSEEGNYAKAAAQKLREQQSSSAFTPKATPLLPKAPENTPVTPVVPQVLRHQPPELATPDRAPSITKNLFGQTSAMSAQKDKEPVFSSSSSFKGFVPQNQSQQPVESSSKPLSFGGIAPKPTTDSPAKSLTSFGGFGQQQTSTGFGNTKPAGGFSFGTPASSAAPSQPKNESSFKGFGVSSNTTTTASSSKPAFSLTPSLSKEDSQPSAVTTSASLPSMSATFASKSSVAATSSSSFGFGAGSSASTSFAAPNSNATTPSLFGAPPSSNIPSVASDQKPAATVVSSPSVSSLFGSKPPATAQVKPSPGGLFGSVATSISGESKAEEITSTPGGLFAPTGGLFGTPKTGGLFGSSPATVSSAPPFSSAPPTSSTSPVIAKPSTAADPTSTFQLGTNSTSTTGGAFSFGKSTTIPATSTSGGLFGTPKSEATSSSTTTGFSFGASTSSTSTAGFTLKSSETSTTVATSTSSTGGLFGSTTSTSTSGGLFGTPTTKATTLESSTKPSEGLFGSSATTNTATGGLFGSTSRSSSGGLFGSSTITTTTSSGSFFGGLSAKESPFGTASATTSSSNGGGLFGNSTATTTSSSAGGMFGSSTTKSSSGLFGSTATPSSSSGGLFGSSATTSSSSGGLFGSTTSSSSSSGGLFGSSTTATSTTSGGLFGSSPASSGGLFGNAAKATASTGLFGSTSTTTSTSGGGLFGSTTASNSPFGGASASGGFGSTNKSNQESSGASSSGGFGGGFGLGGKPINDPNKNPFGSTPAANVANTSSNLWFGGSTTSTFGTQSGQSGQSGGGSFSKGFGAGLSSPQNSNSTFGGGNSGSGSFGSTQAAFGGTPAFGSAPTFGSPSGGGFGAAPVFGSGPTFGGSPPKPTFGANAPTFGSTANMGGGSTFGSNSAVFGGSGGASFGSLANQSGNAPTFGGQQSGATSFGSINQQASGNSSTSPSGSQFSSWR